MGQERCKILLIPDTDMALPPHFTIRIHTTKIFLLVATFQFEHLKFNYEIVLNNY